MLKKRRETAITVYDSNGKTITDETKRNRLAEVLQRFLAVLVMIITAVFSAVMKEWEKLAVIPQKSKNSEEDENARIYTDCRNLITASIIAGFITAVLGLSGKLPFIIVSIGLFEACILITECMVRRDAIVHGRKLKKVEKHLYKETSNAMRAFLTLIFGLTVFAWAITSGKIESVSETFPMLQQFAEWQIAKVNELLEFFDKLVHGQI